MKLEWSGNRVADTEFEEFYLYLKTSLRKFMKINSQHLNQLIKLRIVLFVLRC